MADSVDFPCGDVVLVVRNHRFGRHKRDPIEHPPEAVQIRILTIAGEAVVQQTVNSIPESVESIKVIAEEEINITGADVHVVSDGFTCKATRKARAIEWARLNVNCDQQFVLYLDEDTVVREFHGLPDTDIVQLSERPIRSDGWIPYLAEMFRMGFQIEMRTFPRFKYPLYAWGGGFAVKKSLEDEITWDVNTVTEDTNFIWRAFQNGGVEMQFLDVKLRNQAPPTIREMIHQRRRWISGAIKDRNLLPFRYRVLSLLRNTAWGLVVVSPVLLVPVFTPIEQTLYPNVYGTLLLAQLLGLYGWGIIGYWYYCERLRVLILLIVILPITAISHGIGAFWALLSPTDDFRVTEKVTPEDIAEDESETAATVTPNTGNQNQ